MARFELDVQQMQHPGMALNDVPDKDAKNEALRNANKSATDLLKERRQIIYSLRNEIRSLKGKLEIAQEKLAKMRRR